MKFRYWFYLASVIVLVGLVNAWVLQINKIHAAEGQQQDQMTAAQKIQLEQYVVNQTDSHKLISLAKRLKNADPILLQTIIDRAYILDPTNPDVVALDSNFHPELKAKAEQLNPIQSK